MARTITIPEHLLINVLRHYKALASSEFKCTSLRALNAKRLAPKEIKRLENLLKHITDESKE